MTGMKLGVTKGLQLERAIATAMQLELVRTAGVFRLVK